MLLGGPILSLFAPDKRLAFLEKYHPTYDYRNGEDVGFIPWGRWRVAHFKATDKQISTDFKNKRMRLGVIAPVYEIDLPDGSVGYLAFPEPTRDDVEVWFDRRSDFALFVARVRHYFP